MTEGILGGLVVCCVCVCVWICVFVCVFKLSDAVASLMLVGSPVLRLIRISSLTCEKPEGTAEMLFLLLLFLLLLLLTACWCPSLRRVLMLSDGQS